MSNRRTPIVVERAGKPSPRVRDLGRGTKVFTVKGTIGSYSDYGGTSRNAAYWKERLEYATKWWWAKSSPSTTTVMKFGNGKTADGTKDRLYYVVCTNFTADEVYTATPQAIYEYSLQLTEVLIPGVNDSSSSIA